MNIIKFYQYICNELELDYFKTVIPNGCYGNYVRDFA